MAEAIPDKALARRLDRVARCFDAGGRLQRWPSRRAEQDLALWIIWSQLPGDGQMDELEINTLLRTWHDFEDYVLLRRELIEMDLLRRTPDGRIYRRVARDLPPEAAALAERLGA
ncbi:DUF2087 domain-containing protein [Pelagibacterium sediminicola]|uniref:DUF2087 domain-containing protein n=1 Tax=Pelagibacterium sediminicola TaxID=2248761 RepID=UPI001300BDC0|nr:DUF2087 domain-containing protein [Pelagibacterium sediminicola]